MTRGVLLYAYNSASTDYFSMARWTAARVARFLDLPVSVVTDTQSLESNSVHSEFDRVIIHTAQQNNSRQGRPWHNLDRCRALELSPYDSTLLLDVDYVINSPRLLDLWRLDSDLVCHWDSRYLFENTASERLHAQGPQSAWATVVRFERTQRVQDIFYLWAQVQDNYEHYSNIYHFQPWTVRNDYALTIAVRTAQGQQPRPEDAIPWRLQHVGLNTRVHPLRQTEYVMIHSDPQPNARPQWTKISDTDFHMLHKDNFREITKCGA